MKKAIVTGAAGFIGNRVVRTLLSHDVQVIAIVRKNKTVPDNLTDLPVRRVECDINNYDTLADTILDRDVDAIFHLAWQGVIGPDARNQNVQIMNLSGTLQLIDAGHSLGANTFIGAGSMHEAESLIEMADDKPISNLGYMYKGAKIAAHWMGKAKAGSLGMRFFWPLINTYGEGERQERLLNMVIGHILCGETPSLSDGFQIYDFVHVDDVAEALYLIANKGVDGTNYVIGSGNARPLREFLIETARIANGLRMGDSEIPLGFGAIKSNVISLPIETFDVASLIRDTGFSPKVSFDEGIRRTAVWLNEQMKFD
ncbi:MAG TPA: NAD-dependent epimerase/dehydratase family protein [Eubacteriales bacterium]|nr:NAD-dependent epimerase/dehydratase family protein [Clostridia bacterium]HRV73301.1 NAD-dependent epimerase/dehydratase family protein [Eubacteriales bacterium]